MNEADVRRLAGEVLAGIAPEADLAQVGDDADLRETLDLDSMDFLNFVTAVHKQLGVPIPELDYPRLASLNGAVQYLLLKLPQ